MPLTGCPPSNVRLGVVADIRRHPLGMMVERGLAVTVNSDDPAYFGGYVNDNYRAVADPMGLTVEQLAALARNSFEASFLASANRQRPNRPPGSTLTWRRGKADRTRATWSRDPMARVRSIRSFLQGRGRSAVSRAGR